MTDSERLSTERPLETKREAVDQAKRRLLISIAWLLVFVFPILAIICVPIWWLSCAWSTLSAYERKTTELADTLEAFTPDEWEQLYHESEQIFLANSRSPLEIEELPGPFQGLEFTSYHVDQRGVFYRRSGRGFTSGSFIHVRSVHSPDGLKFERRGVWLEIPDNGEWVYEP